MTWCIEIKSSNTPTISKGFFHCVEDLKPDEKRVIVPESRPIIRPDGVMITSLSDFLQSIQGA
jgi:hypothetical protein